MSTNFDQEEPLSAGGIHRRETERLAALGAAFPAMAHRIGGALNRIALFGQVLERNLQSGASTDELASNATQIMEAVTQVSLLLKHMQAVSRLGSEPVKEVSLSELTLSIADQVTPAATERGIRVSASIDSPCIVRGRANGLGRMVRGLCEHGIEAMSGGGMLTIEVRAAGDQAVLIVRDTGLCPPYELDDADPLTMTQLDPTGLGLAVASHTALQHGGSIAASPNPEGGMAVTVALPLARRTPSQRPLSQRPEGSCNSITDGERPGAGPPRTPRP